MKILYLTIKKQWYDMIYAGIKRHEYRANIDYWNKRLDGKHYDAICFANGPHFGDKIPKFFIELKMKSKGFGRTEWGGDPNNFQWVLYLGEILDLENLKGKGIK